MRIDTLNIRDTRSLMDGMIEREGHGTMHLTPTVRSEDLREICGASELKSMDSPEVSILDGIVETSEEHCVVLSPAVGPIRRRILHVNSYGGRLVWDRIK